MTLPYPHGVETGELRNIDPGRPDPLDLEARVHKLVVPAATHVDVAGARLRVNRGASVEFEAERFRGRLVRRLLERRPNADDATMRKLAEGLRAALSSHRNLDDAAIEQALELVDGL